MEFGALGQAVGVGERTPVDWHRIIWSRNLDHLPPAYAPLRGGR